METLTDKTASKYLGKKIEGSTSYDSSFLVAVPRFENRKQYNITEEKLPFEGWDVWHGYEFSTLTENGLPVTCVMKLRYSCRSEYIIESKSLKLYLNSFNMTKFGKNISECLDICKKIIENDLSEKIQSPVEIKFLSSNSIRKLIFSDYKNLYDFADENKILIENYKETPELLEWVHSEKIQSYYFQFDSLRSNCRVTHQPDFGDLFIYYKSAKHIKEASLIKYLCSFRSEYHFHEECVEMIYKRLYDILDEEDEIMVCALYTRRGGIDICPVRYSKNCSIFDYKDLIDINQYARCGIKQ